MGLNLYFYRSSQNRSQEKGLLKLNHRANGRNHSGVITCRHRGGGHKRIYRKIDFWRKKLNLIGQVQAITYDPNRNANIVLIFYKNGQKSYILAPKGIQISQNIVSGFFVPIKIGNALPLWNIPFGTGVHNVELFPGTGGQLARAAGTNIKVVVRENGFVILRLPSREVRLVPQTCWATVGQVSNADARNTVMRKAGRLRWLGCRPTVRGSVINSVDHPHGGGEGRCPIGHALPLTPWGKPRLGQKTRQSKKYSDTFILRRGKR